MSFCCLEFEMRLIGCNFVSMKCVASKFRFWNFGSGLGSYFVDILRLLLKFGIWTGE